MEVVHVNALGPQEQVTKLGGIKLCPFIPIDKASIVGAIYSVEIPIPDAHLPTFIKLANEGTSITQVHRPLRYTALGSHAV